MVNVSNRDRLAAIPPLPGSSGAPQTAVTYGPARQGQQTYTLDQFRSNPGGGVPGTGDGKVKSSDRTKAKFAPIARGGDNQGIYAEHLARARSMGYLMPGSNDRRRVIALQQKLNAVGISVPVSGTFEYGTSQAVRNFKSRIGLNDGFVDKQGNFAVSDVMTPEAENALTQLATQAGWVPTGPQTDREATPGWQKAMRPIQGTGTQVPQSPTGVSGSAVTPDEFARFQHLQQIARPRAQGGNGYTLTADQRRFYEDVRQRLIANGGVVGSPSPAPVTGPTGPSAGNGPLALLRQQLNHDGPVSPAEVAAADAFEAALSQDPTAFDNQPGIMVINFQAIRMRQQQFGVQGSQGSQGVQSPGPSAASTYTVKQGDTFQSIAEALTGDKGNWQVIYDANKDRLAAWQAQRPQMTKQFNEYYKTTLVPNPYLLPKGFQLTIPGAGGDDPGVSPPSKPKKTTNTSNTVPTGELQPKTTWSSNAVDMEQYQWFQAKREAFEAGTLPEADKQAFIWIANKGPVTAELDAYLQNLQKGGSGNDVGGAPGSGGRNSMTVDINDPDEDLQAALAILKKQQSGQAVSPEERMAYRALMSKYQQKTMEGN
jgi:LysM repeat protein